MESPYAIVTGAGTGIGAATAQRLADEGMMVAVTDIDAEAAEGTATRVRGAGGAATAVRLDVTHPGSVDEAIHALTEAHGPPAVLVNNAGYAVAATLPETSVDAWERTVGVNLTGPFLMCRAVLPAMIGNGGGAIVNVASVGGLVGLANRAAYCATKAGVVGLTRSIAADHSRDGIRANAICPGTVATGWVDRIVQGAEDPEAQRRAMAARQLDGRMGSPEEVAAGIAFLVSDDGRFVNGSAFIMDGGLTAV